MTDTPADSLIPYDEIVQDALRSVVRRVLDRIDAEGGLPGNHHFYIAFRTRYPGVEIPKHLLERSHADYNASNDLTEMIRANLIAERVAIEAYSQMVDLIGDKDPTTKRLLEQILNDE